MTDLGADCKLAKKKDIDFVRTPWQKFLLTPV